MTGGGEQDALDCFVSYADDGRTWAEWIAWQLKDAGYRIRVESWDLAPGDNHVAWRHRAVSQARHTIAVVTDGYLRSPTAAAEWTAAWSADSPGDERRLLVVRTTDRPLPGLLHQVTPLDLFDRGDLAARTELLAAVRGGRGGPEIPPVYPGGPIYPRDLPAVWNVPEPPGQFVGRADSLARLDAAFARSPLVAVTGIAGIGKTSLVTEYVRQHHRDLDAVWWVPAGRPELVGERIRALAPALGLPEHAEPPAVLAHLARSDGRWLVVLDDAADAAGLPGWLRPAGAGRLLLTSRNPEWDGLGALVPVGPMTRTDSITLLADRRPSIDAAVAAGIAERLGDHPLALAQAADRLRRGGAPAESYLEALTTRPADLLAQDEAPHRPGVSVATLWDESIRRLDAETPAAGHLLRLVAQGDDAPLPIRLLTAEPDAIGDAGLRAKAGDPLDLAETIAAVERSGLVHRDGSAVTMHGLIRSAARAHTTPEQADQIVTGLTRMLRALLPESVTANPAAWPAWRELLPHALTVLDATEAGRLAAADSPQTAWLAEHAAAYLLEHGHAERAVPLAERAVHARNDLDGPDHPDTLTSREVLTRATLAAGDIPTAGRLAETTLADRTRILGRDHPDTLTSQDVLARVLRQDGQLGDAIDLFERTLDGRTRVLGDRHPDTLASRHSLGGAYDDAGRGDQATDLLRDTLADRRRVLGPEHPATLDTRHDLAVAYRRTGALPDAVAQFERTLNTRRDVLGPDHPATLDTRHHLGITYHQTGRLDDATRNLDEALTLREDTLGPDHPATLDSAHGLARVHLGAGRPEQALPLFERALNGRVRTLSPDHHDTVETRELIAESYVSLGRPGDAVPHLEYALDRHNEVLGSRHPRTVGAREALATAYRRMGQLEEARPLTEQLLGDHARAHGVSDIRTLQTADRLANLYQSTGRLPQAIDLNERVLAIRTTTLGSGHPDTTTSRDVLADTYRQASRPADAVRLYREALADAMREHGPFHPDTTRSRRALADSVNETRRDLAPPPERPSPAETRLDHRW
ncbi:tetratricopeptide repeat protein [Frankia sp. QA3]|uniref:tetratricopeptide repeat protein n=1 Tax=Frankia sp. QA3 TaxID=710111 RepID=UPI000269BCB2|nr:tetratricopeptide repeat protein [Frankia sp. QA3]EIV91784.1 TPR repeat-containing protein [Frankia sp. QA3]